MSPGSRSWDESHSRNLLAQALGSPRSYQVAAACHWASAPAMLAAVTRARPSAGPAALAVGGARRSHRPATRGWHPRPGAVSTFRLPAFRLWPLRKELEGGPGRQWPRASACSTCADAAEVEHLNGHVGHRPLAAWGLIIQRAQVPGPGRCI
jgi:hypothetical protein